MTFDFDVFYEKLKTSIFSFYVFEEISFSQHPPPPVTAAAMSIFMPTFMSTTFFLLSLFLSLLLIFT